MDRGNWLAYNPWNCKESDTKAHSRTKNFKGTNNKASLCSLIFPQMCDLWSQKYTLIFKFTFRQQWRNEFIPQLDAKGGAGKKKKKKVKQDAEKLIQTIVEETHKRELERTQRKMSWMHVLRVVHWYQQSSVVTGTVTIRTIKEVPLQPGLCTDRCPELRPVSPTSLQWPSACRRAERNCRSSGQGWLRAQSCSDRSLTSWTGSPKRAWHENL